MRGEIDGTRSTVESTNHTQTQPGSRFKRSISVSNDDKGTLLPHHSFTHMRGKYN